MMPEALNLARLNARALTDAGLIDALRKAQRDGNVAITEVFGDERARRIAECTMCQATQGRMAPSHFASPRCESGRRSHCTCDVCF